MVVSHQFLREFMNQRIQGIEESKILKSKVVKHEEIATIGYKKGCEP
jgi:hypothetical protein